MLSPLVELTIDLENSFSWDYSLTRFGQIEAYHFLELMLLMCDVFRLPTSTDSYHHTLF